MKFKKFFSVLIAAASVSFAADWASSYQTMIAFDKTRAEGNRPGYVKPLATYFSAVQNGSWLTGVTVPKSLSFEIGLPINLAFIADREYTSANVATIFGKKEEYVYNQEIGRNVIGGNENLNGLSVFTVPALQAGIGFYHAKILLRAMWLPTISELQSYNQLGIALQYSFAQYFRKHLPPALRSLDVSLLWGYNNTDVSYTPDKFAGSLDLDFSSHHFMIAFGYSPVQLIEVMLSLGYETSNMDASGKVWQEESPSDVILPNMNIDGRSGFRLGIEIAFTLGQSFHPVVGPGIGAANTMNANLLYFKQSFGKDEE
ncbi:MAG: hypothetical protein LBR60_06940 [Fibrobacter sp.]|jgi:hypothetical protein|nr:hypothetical protein [Fibrobacter sp.]